MPVKDKEEKEELGRGSLTSVKAEEEGELVRVSDFNTVLRKLWPC